MLVIIMINKYVNSMLAICTVFSLLVKSIGLQQLIWHEVFVYKAKKSFSNVTNFFKGNRYNSLIFELK